MLFRNPDVIDVPDLKLDKNFDESLLKKFLIQEKGFAESRV